MNRVPSFLFILVFFAKFPSLVADPKTTETRGAQILAEIQDPEARSVLIAAHRGGYEEDKMNQAPENSVANVRACIKAGFEIYETDLQRTRDGRFVVVHDPTIERETNGEGAISDLTFEEVRALKKKYRDGTLSEERVASFEELLEAGRDDLLFKIDLKPGVVDHFDELARIVEKFGMLDRVFFRLRWKEADQIEELFKQGTPRSAGLVMFMVSRPEEAIAAIERFKPTTLQVNVPSKNPLKSHHRKCFQIALEAGVCIEAHCYEDPERWEELIGQGVRIFHSNPKPLKLKKWLQKMGRAAGL